jgi:hypothetical protein
MRSQFKAGQKVWAAIAINPRYSKGKLVTYLTTRDGRFLPVEDEDGHRHSVARFHVFASRAALVAKFPDLEVDAPPAAAPTMPAKE